MRAHINTVNLKILTTKQLSFGRRYGAENVIVSLQEGFDKSDVKKALLESLYEQRKEQRRKELDKELKRAGGAKKKLTEKGDDKREEEVENTQRNGGRGIAKNSEVKSKDKGKIRISKSSSKELLKSKERIRNPETEVRDKGKFGDLEVVCSQKEKRKEIPEETKAIVERGRMEAEGGIAIESLPSTRDFIRFISLDYSEGKFSTSSFA